MRERIIMFKICFWSAMISCNGQSPTRANLMQSKHLKEFPSCSAVTYRNGSLYLIGDDATHIYTLDSEYRVVDSLKIFEHAGKRIPKKTKHDLEAATIFVENSKTFLLTMGSAATEQRELVRIIPFVDELDIGNERIIATHDFIANIRPHVGEVNIEGVAHVGKDFVLSNRANSNHPTNYFIITSGPFWIDQERVNFHIAEIDHTLKSEQAIGVSDLFYDEGSDLLFISFSTELTTNAYADGSIGDSYLGYIRDFSKKIVSCKIAVDEMINLAKVDALFKNQKIEGVCVESIKGGKYIIHLTSDDDQGSSMIFKLQLHL
jgi:hypothetical protein